MTVLLVPSSSWTFEEKSRPPGQGIAVAVMMMLAGYQSEAGSCLMSF